MELFQESDDKYKYSVAWIDCLAGGKSLGRSVLMRGNHATATDVKNKEPLFVKDKNKLNVPFNLPGFILNQFSIKAFNSLYYSKYKDNSHVLTDYDSFFYPLDSVSNWNRIYGKKGFLQYQAVIPSQSGRTGLIQLLEKLSSSKKSSFLAVLKSSGEQNQGLLSFPKRGYTLALDIPIHDDSIFRLIKDLDNIVLKHDGRVYLAKDSVMDYETFKVMYPNAKRFKKIKDELDPNHLFSSSMARRLKLVEES